MPFCSRKRRQQCLKWMADISQGSIHLALGINASRTPPIHKLRYCPQCLAEQLEKYGEYYWFRLWQIQGTCCPQHGQLIDSELDLRSLHRHDFWFHLINHVLTQNKPLPILTIFLLHPNC